MRVIKSTLLVFITLFSSLTSLAQENVLLTIDGEEITKSEFERVYNKNNASSSSIDPKTPEEYLELFINFKLKVAEAKDLGMADEPSFKKELDGYVSDLAEPYLTDNAYNADLVKEAYNRMLVDVSASHIMVALKKGASPEDTVVAYNKAMAIYKEAKEGADFSQLAFEKSEDPSAKDNKGYLGYFTAFRMVYPFETAAYTTPEGGVTKPVKTSYGYHIIKVEGTREAMGELRTAHIFVKTNEKMSEAQMERAEGKINELYEKLKNGADFFDLARTYSEDNGSAKSGGVLPWFGAGRMVPNYEEAAAQLEKGNYSMPIQTPYGWHIIMLVDKKEIGSFEEEQVELEKKVQRDSRSAGSEKHFIQLLKTEYKVKTKEKVAYTITPLIDSTIFEAKWEGVPEEMEMKGTVLQWSDKTYLNRKEKRTLKDFAAYLQSSQQRQKAVSFEEYVKNKFTAFISNELLDYQKEVLPVKYPEYKALVAEYHDGILLFELMDQKVWTKASEDSAGLAAYYEAHKMENMWDQRIDASIYIFSNEEMESRIRPLIEQGATDSTILATANAKSSLGVTIWNGTYQKNDQKYLNSIDWTTGIKETQEDGDKRVVVRVNEVLEPAPMALDDAKGVYISGYQKFLEDKWIKELRSKFPFTVNQEVLSTVENNAGK